MYEYKATVIKVVDGDTCDCRIDLGFKASIEMRFRLTGINAPEMQTPEGAKSKARLLELMPLGSDVTVRSAKDKQEKFGRYLGTFYDPDGHDINARMVLEGFAIPFMTLKG